MISKQSTKQSFHQLQPSSKNALQDHKANGNHDFAAQDDFQGLQKTVPGTAPDKRKWSRIINIHSKDVISEIQPQKWNVYIGIFEKKNYGW